MGIREVGAWDTANRGVTGPSELGPMTESCGVATIKDPAKYDAKAFAAAVKEFQSKFK